MTEPAEPASRHPPRVSRRVLLGGAAALGAAVAVDGLAITPRRLVTSLHTVGAAAGPRRLRLVQVSDLHVHGIGMRERQLFEQLHALKADVVVLTGDALDRPGALATLHTLLGEFPRSPRTFAILGNWEYRCGFTADDMARLYDRHGIELLVNRSVTLEHEGAIVRITGLDDLLHGRPDADGPLADAVPVAHHVVLAHCPLSRDAVRLPPRHAATFMLAGHSHGGQVAPFGFAPVLPHACGRYVAGWYHGDGPPLFVSRGIGTSFIPVRIGASPELAVFDWQLATAAAS